MLTRTRNALVLAALAASSAVGLGLLWKNRRAPELHHVSLDAVPSGAILVATADLDALRASPLGAPLWKQSREIPGLGKLRDVCGFDPIDSIHEIAVAIPAGGDAGDFGLVAAGDVDADALVACATKVITARGGDPVATAIGSFRTVRDRTIDVGGGEIAVRPHGPVLLGAGDYLRRMIDAADGHTSTIRSSLAHTELAREVGDGAIRISVVLTPEQRKGLAEALKEEGSAPSPAVAIEAAAIAVRLDPNVAIRAVVACDDAPSCSKLVSTLSAARDARASDLGTRILGVGALLERIQIEADGTALRAHVELPADEASALLDRVLTLRSFRHPMPRDTGAHPSDRDPPLVPDEIIPGASATPSTDAGPPKVAPKTPKP